MDYRNETETTFLAEPKVQIFMPEMARFCAFLFSSYSAVIE